MAMPPIVLILGFVGLPIVTAGLYSLGHVGGLNATTAAIGQHQHEAQAHRRTVQPPRAASRARRDQ